MNENHLREAADFFHEREGDLLARTETVTALARSLGVNATTASALLAGLAGDEVDPVIAVRTARETFVGVLDYHEGDGWYGFTDHHEFRGEFHRGVCAQCVHEATTDEEVHTVTTADDDWSALADEIRDHYERAHPEVEPESVSVETGAVLRSRTTVGGNRVWHTGNDGAGSGFGSATVDGVEGATLNRRHTSDVDRHLDLERLGLKLWYRFDMGTGASAYDYNNVGETNPGTISGASWTTDSKTGEYALSFDGADDNVAVKRSFPNLEQYTLTAWIRTTNNANGTFQTIFTLQTNNGIHPGVDGRDNSHQGNLRYYHDGSEYNEPLSSGIWYHFAQVWDGDTVYCYLDGAEVGTLSDSGNSADGQNGDAIGARQDGQHPFYGEIDDARVYERALSQSEVQAIYDGVA